MTMRESRSGLALAWLDVKRMWSSRAVRISLLGLLVLPLLYSFIYLWAFWNPTGHTDQLSLAIVNEDQGAKRSGEQRNLGRELTDKLLANQKTSWRETNSEQAHSGVLNGTYAMALYLPADFSRKAFSVSGDQPEPTLLQVELSEGNNMLTANVVRAITRNVQNDLRTELQGNYLTVIFEQVLNGAEGLQEAADGAAKLSDASQEAYQGASRLADGLRQEAPGIAKLSGGVQALTAGADEMERGLTQLNTWSQLVSSEWNKWNAKLNETNQSLPALMAELDAAKPKLSQALKQLDADTTFFADQLQAVKQSAVEWDQLQSRLQRANANVNDLNDSLDLAKSQLPELSKQYAKLSADPKFKQLTNALTQAQKSGTNIESELTGIQQAMASQTAAINQAIGQLEQRQAQMQQRMDALNSQTERFEAAANDISALLDRQHANVNTINERVTEVTGGVARLQQGGNQLRSGLEQLSAGMSALQTGNAKLVDGASALSAGLAQIHSGQAELSDKLSDAAGMASEDGQAEARQAVINDPVKMEERNLHPVPSNGVGFAPYFIALSLWVGSLVLFFVIDIWQVLERPHGALSYIVNKYIALATVSVCQALLSVFILHTGLGIPTVVAPIAMYVYAVLVGLVFTAILFMLIAVLGSDKGRFAAVLILMLQLTSSSGSYPVELEPAFFRHIHPLLPMTYAVDGLRHLISIGGWNEIIRTAVVLSGFGIGSLLLFYWIKRRKIMAEISISDGQPAV
ncbi:YhgE/Pip domain-containing protein [Paenibacillus silvisoli]|uniref:YhgE/Pip domain-containing protein n=1 Tax=Paenibacillus silvisoli TaxID=3110539 RepID=UPI002805D732|nr:YhgE/Pip domain-containing protein [Paenibacillus silvisoli]